MYNMYVLFDTQGRKKQNETGARKLLRIRDTKLDFLL